MSSHPQLLTPSLERTGSRGNKTASTKKERETKDGQKESGEVRLCKVHTVSGLTGGVIVQGAWEKAGGKLKKKTGTLRRRKRGMSWTQMSGVGVCEIADKCGNVPQKTVQMSARFCNTSHL